MNPLRIVKDYLVILVDILKISSPLEFGDAYIETGIKRDITVNLPYAYANSGFLRRVGIRPSVVKIYPKQPGNKDLLYKSSEFILKETEQQFFCINEDPESGRKTLSECMAISSDWFDINSIVDNPIEAQMKLLPELSIKPKPQKYNVREWKRESTQ